MPSLTQSILLGAALAVSPTLALAQTDANPADATSADAVSPQAGSAAPAQGKIVFNAAPAPAPNGGDSSRTFHYHDGFYARLGLNYGLTGGGISIGDRQLDYSGSQLGLDLLIGGTPSDGLALGGGVLFGSILQPDVKEGGQSIARKNVPVLLVGPFVDGFFKPNAGWHAGALLGLGALGETTETQGALGFGGSAWIGYDQWVGDDWSVGAQIRFLGIAAGGNKPADFSASALGIGFGFSVLYH